MISLSRFEAILITMLLVVGCAAPPKSGEVSVTSPMETLSIPVEFGYGPRFGQEFLLLKTYPEPLFLTGFRVVLLDKEGGQLEEGRVPLDWWEVSWVNRERHGQLLGRHSDDSDSLVRLPGNDRELVFPDGFGLPVYSNEPLRFRGGWSVSAEDLEKPLEVRAQLTVSFLRANQLEKPVSPLFCQTAWAGGLDANEGYEPWMIQEKEKASGRFSIAGEAKPVLEKWFHGPDLENVKKESDQSNFSRAFSAERRSERRTALGVNLYLPDTDWKGWPQETR